MTTPQKADSVARLRVDIASAKILVWFASVGRDADLTSESHLYFFDRYGRLADCHRRRGQMARARRLQRNADEHYRLSGLDGPPYAAAMAMPRPTRWVSVEACSQHRLDGPDEAA
jgi:hypothetical protein